jgi:hypothetical protein
LNAKILNAERRLRVTQNGIAGIASIPIVALAFSLF